MLDREAIRSVIQQWNANRLDLFALSEPDEKLLFHGVMRFYFQDSGQKVATKCIRVASDATVADVIDTLIEKFRPDMRMLSVPNYALYEVHANGEERKLNSDEKPLLVQLNWHIDDREGRFLLKNIDQKTTAIDNTDINFKRKLSKREKKEQKKKEKLAKLNSDTTGTAKNETQVAGKLYNELPETSFTRSISNPEAVMRRRRQQKLEKKLQQFRSRDGGPDTGGTLKIYGESLCQDVPYKTLLLSIRDCAQAVVREMLSKYGLDKADPLHYCLVQVNCDGTEYILDDDECPLSILMNHPTSRGSIMFHVRRRPADSQPRRRKKKPIGASNGPNNCSSDREGPVLVEVTHSGDGGRRIRLGNEPVEVGSANTNSLQLFGPSIQPRHCLIGFSEGVCTVTPLHADALSFVNGHHITQPTILHNGSVVMFGRVASYRFLDSPSDGRYNLALSQSQLDSACLYESRSPTSPASWNDEDGSTNLNQKTEFNSTNYHSGIISEHSLNMTGDNKKKLAGRSSPDLEVNYDGSEINLESNVETKSISSSKSNGSANHDQRSQKNSTGMENQGQEAILPAVLEFPETNQEKFLCQIITEQDIHGPYFKLAPVYTLYLCARYRASTHYRPELQPTERAHKLTTFLHHVANLIYSVIQEKFADPRMLAFWMANSSEFLHFLKSDRHISAFSLQAQEILAESVQTAFRNLVNCFREELSQTLNQFLSETIDHDSAAGLVLTVLGSAMALLRRCRVNAALTIQLFSQLFHYINVICFNMIVANSHMCTSEWGKVLTERLQLLELWAERQGLELAADCHLAKINQCAQFLQAPKTCVEEIQKLACTCFRLNSLQMSALLQQEKIPRHLIDTAIRMAESVADELTKADGREVRLEESPELHLALLLPDDGFSCDVVRGIPSGLVDFLNPLQTAGMCRLAAQPTSIGLWTVYMQQFNARSSSSMSNKLPQPEVQVIKLQKNSNGMGLSIVAAKGAGQERLGIYIKSVVPGGAADTDGRLLAGDQLLRVDGQSLIGITQERAADYLVRTGPVVTLEVAKQGAIYHGLATLLQQPSPVIQRGGKRLSERDISRLRGESKIIGQLMPISHLANSKSVPALHHSSNVLNANNCKSRSTHSLLNSNEQGFYQNISVYRAQNQNQHNFEERPKHDSINSHGDKPNLSQPQPSLNSIGVIPQGKSVPTQISSNHKSILSRPASVYYQSTINPNFTGNISNTQHNTMTPFNDNHGISTSASNISTGGNVSTSNGQMNFMHPQSSTIGNRSHNYNIEGQMQNNLRMNQILAPSMPNITVPHITPSLSAPNTSISSSQSMLNVTMPSHSTNLGDTIQQYGFTNLSHIQQYSSKYTINSLRTPITQPIIGELPTRRNRVESISDNLHQQHQEQQRQQEANNITKLPSKSHGMINNSNMIPLSSKHSKSQLNRGSQYYIQNVEDTPPLPPTATHPLFNLASTSDPPKGGYYPVNLSGNQTNFIGSNPWEREEREKAHEIRREHLRQWRDQQIAELSSLNKLTPQQEEQLKALVLERDFEKRVQEEEEQDDGNESPFERGNYQEVVRLNVQQNSIQSPITNFHQTDIKTDQGESNEQPSQSSNLNDSQLYGNNYQQNQPPLTAPPKGILKNNRYDNTSFSLIPSSPLKSQKSASFADERRLQTDHTLSNIAKDISNMNIDEVNMNNKEDILLTDHNTQFSGTINVAPPPLPPERNSSYIVMSQQQKNRNSGSITSKTNVSSPSDMQSENNMLIYSNNNKQLSFVSTNTNNNNITLKTMPSNNSNEIHSTISSSQFPGRDSKRVSFHGEENNYISSQMLSEQSYENEQSELRTDDENSHDFIVHAVEESQNQTIPDGDMWNSTVPLTPGVIGAQEVYRDPRQRRLAEQQQKQLQRTNEAVPEKLSFKEKMKIFALESGEGNTPKDKLKTSRAQRDIDAVH